MLPEWKKSHFIVFCMLTLILAIEFSSDGQQLFPQWKPVLEQQPSILEPDSQVQEKKANVQSKVNVQSKEQVALSNEQLLELNKNTPIMHGDVSKYPKVEVIATGYYAGKESTGKEVSHPSYGITFSGVKVRRDIYSTVAADPKMFPLGTILYIPGYGYGVVCDTGSAIKGNKIDLYYETIDEIYNEWGKRTVEVFIVRKGNGKVTEAMLEDLNAAKPVEAIIQS
jgi:3D (Asp-Asp-Asp) domain-containing protein